MASSWLSFFVLVFLQVVDLTRLTNWPYGLYGLLKPKTGCPEKWTDNGWIDNGFLFQDTVDSNTGNNRSEILHIDGYVGPSFVMKYFCVKTTYHITGSTNTDWPQGQYCIHRKKQRYWESELDWIKMYDEWHKNKDEYKFTHDIFNIHYTRYNSYDYTMLYFSCQINGNKNIPIELPITKPFYLLPYGSSECQQVKWMVATTEWIKYRTDDHQGYPYPYKNGKVPYHERDYTYNRGSGITMYYCYYKSCNFTLTEKKGVFQSPGFPGKYPDGQLCSWRIMVPANHTIHVHFTNFSLYGNNKEDNLTFFKHVNVGFQLNTTYHGNRQPFTITATSDLEFVFSTNQVHNSNGFRAEYNVFIPCESTCTPLPTIEKPKTTTPKTTLPQTTTAQTTLPQTTTPQTTTPQTTTPQTTTPQTTTPQTTTPQTTTPQTTTPQTTTPQTTTPQITKRQTIKRQALTTIKKTDELTTKLIQTTKTLLITSHSYYTSNKFMDSCVCGRDLTWRIAVIVIPLVCCILIVFLVVDILCRCRAKRKEKFSRSTNCPEQSKVQLSSDKDSNSFSTSLSDFHSNMPFLQLFQYKKEKSTANDPRSGDRLAVNLTYERGDILLNEPAADTTTVDVAVDANEDQPLSRDEPLDYEDLDYTQINEIPCPNLDNEAQKRYILEPISNDVPEVFYHVLEGPKYLNRPTYENVAEVDHFTFNPVYEPAENSAPFIEMNRLYDK